MLVSDLPTERPRRTSGQGEGGCVGPGDTCRGFDTRRGHG